MESDLTGAFYGLDGVRESKHVVHPHLYYSSSTVRVDSQLVPSVGWPDAADVTAIMV